MKKIPVFHSEEEEACFWDNEDTTDYLDQFESVELELDPELEKKIMRRRKGLPGKPKDTRHR